MVYEELGIYQVRLPLPFRLNHINCYALKGATGWCLVDTGLNTQETREGWQRFFAEQDIAPADILGIYVTHFHPDHYGCSGWLQNYAGGAPVYIGEIDAARVARYWKNQPYAIDILRTLFSNNGMPEDVLVEVMAAFAKVIFCTAPHAELSTLRPGQTLRLGDHEYQVILTPGHSDGHICFYNESHGLLLTGDHLLPEITSNISLWPQPGADPDPLDNFLCSLKQMRALNCRSALPAHGKPFGNVEERICQLEAHHQERLALMKSCAGSGATAYQVCCQVFRQDLSNFEMRFAMAETLAHLVYLTLRNELEAASRDGVTIYSRKAQV